MLVHFYSKAHHVHNCSNDDTKGAFEFMRAKWVAVNQFCPRGQASKPLPLPLSVHIVYGWPLMTLQIVFRDFSRLLTTSENLFL